MRPTMCDPLLFSAFLPACDLAGFVSKLDPLDVHARFGRWVDPRDLPSLLAPLDPNCHAIGAWTGRSLAGVGMLVTHPDTRCELALLVRSDLKRRRIGTALTHRAFAAARGLGAGEIVAHIRSDNTAALRLVRSLGFRCTDGPGLELAFVTPLAAYQAAG